MECARLTRYGLLSVTGDDARAFLHAQLTKDIENLPPDRATLAGWCSAKGRLLASLLVIPAAAGARPRAVGRRETVDVRPARESPHRRRERDLGTVRRLGRRGDGAGRPGWDFTEGKHYYRA